MGGQGRKALFRAFKKTEFFFKIFIEIKILLPCPSSLAGVVTNKQEKKDKGNMKKFKVFIMSLVICLCGGFLFACTDTPGKSAYDIAVEHGFIGTEEEWLESLEGSNGVDGEDGELTAESLFEKAVEFGLYENTKEGYEEFLKDYFLASSDTTVEEVANKCINSVVSIFIPTDQVGYFSCGSGVVIELNKEENYAYILTNYHVVVTQKVVNNNYVYEIGNEIYCYTYGYENLTVDEDETQNIYNDGFKASYIGGSAEYDLAVLKVSGEEFEKIENRDIIPATFGDSSEIHLGEEVVAIGNAKGNLLSITQGAISKVNEITTVNVAGETRATIGFRLDASINKGNSGGGVFNMSGELVGIANAKYMAVGYEGLGNAIYSNLAEAVSENIIESYESGNGESVGVRKVVFGVMLDRTTNSSSDYDEITGITTLSVDAEVTEVTSGSVADKMGVKVQDKIVGAVVTRLDGSSWQVDFKLSYDLNEFAVRLRVGDSVAFVVERGEVERLEQLDAYTIQESDIVVSKDNA